MNFSDIKNLISEEGKVVFIENDKIVGVFLSYEEYRKIAAQKNCSQPSPTASLPLFEATEKPNSNQAVGETSPLSVNPVSEAPNVSAVNEVFDEPSEIVAEEPEVIIMPERKPTEIGQDKELTIDDLPF